MPLTAAGSKSDHVIAFARQHEGTSVVVAVPRLCARLLNESHDTICKQEIWGDAELTVPKDDVSCYHNLFTGECLPVKTPGPANNVSSIRLAEVFRTFPVALLLSEPQDPSKGCAIRN